MDPVAQAFADDVTFLDFLSTRLPDLLKSHKDFASFFEGEPIFSIFLKDLNKRFSYKLHATGQCDVEAREMVDFPLATLVVESSVWPMLRPFLARWVPKFFDSMDEFKNQIYLSKEVLDKFERVDGTFDLVLKLTDATAGGEPTGTLILNDYDPQDGVPQCKLTVSEQALWDVLDGGTGIAALASSIRLQGDIGFAATVGHILYKGK